MESENPIEALKEEHEKIERELLELETIMQETDINYSNFVHVWKRLLDLWENHEMKEEKMFPIMEKERIKMPVKKMLFEHRELKPHKATINKALMSGSNKKMKIALEKSGKIIIKKLRNHINSEDEILYTLALEEFTEEELKELSQSVQ
jgi:hypothetical protein